MTTAPYYEDEFVTIYHADAREILPTLEADVIVTDPPYGIGWSKGANAAPGRQSRQHDGIASDEDTSVRDAVLDLTADTPGLVFGSFYAPQPARLKQVLAWRKPPDAGVFGSVTGFRRDVEPVYIVGPWPLRTVQWSSVLDPGTSCIGTYAREVGHPHAKPVPLMRELIERCPPGVIVDPFCGSGSTLRAAKDLGRRCIGIELVEEYCEMAASRVAQDCLFGEAA